MATLIKQCVTVLVLVAVQAMALAETTIPLDHHQPTSDGLMTFESSPEPTVGSQAVSKSGFLTTPSHAVLVALDQARLSSKFAGEIAKISVRPGSSFKKGQVLIQFECDEQQASYQKALAEERSSKTAEDAAIKLDQLESISKLEVAKAKAAYARAKAQANYATALLAKCQIKAPYAGTVVELPVKAHETVKPGDPLIEIVNNDSLVVRVYAPSTWLKWIKPKTRFIIKLKEYPKPIGAHVVKVVAAVDTSSQTIQLYGQLDKKYKGLVNGMSGLAYFEGQAQ